MMNPMERSTRLVTLSGHFLHFVLPPWRWYPDMQVAQSRQRRRGDEEALSLLFRVGGSSQKF
jgi:hypothetical protein